MERLCREDGESGFCELRALLVATDSATLLRPDTVLSPGEGDMLSGVWSLLAMSLVEGGRVGEVVRVRERG